MFKNLKDVCASIKRRANDLGYEFRPEDGLPDNFDVRSLVYIVGALGQYMYLKIAEDRVAIVMTKFAQGIDLGDPACKIKATKTLKSLIPDGWTKSKWKEYTKPTIGGHHLLGGKALMREAHLAWPRV
ncbi:MAG: hypothetical protein NTZ80_03355 [Patescibacteria group bacterium]|nr:hypothetical protein [Patescibacteria group bacterium]